MDHDYTILLVDDEPDASFMVEALVSGEFNLVAAETGEEALERFGECAPLVVLTDAMLCGELDGFDVCRKIRQEYKSDCGIIMISALAEFEGCGRALAAGADDFITKPYHGELLLARLRLFKRMADALGREKCDTGGRPPSSPGRGRRCVL